MAWPHVELTLEERYKYLRADAMAQFMCDMTWNCVVTVTRCKICQKLQVKCCCGLSDQDCACK